MKATFAATSGHDHHRPQQAARADDGTPPRRRIGRGAEVLEGNRGIVRVAGRLANGIRSIRNGQSAAIVLLFHFFRLMSTLLIFVGVARQCLSMLFTIVFMH